MNMHLKTLTVLAIVVSTAIVIAQESTTIEQNQVYVCAPCNRKCDDLKFTKPGICEHCNMQLIKETELINYPKMNRRKIGFYLQSGVEILDFAGPMEVFAYAGYEIFTISKTKEQIYGQGILTITPDYDLSDAPEADMLVFFGGNAVLPSKDPELIEWVKSQKNIKHYFSVCSGALILAEAGLLENKGFTYGCQIRRYSKGSRNGILYGI